MSQRPPSQATAARAQSGAADPVSVVLGAAMDRASTGAVKAKVPGRGAVHLTLDDVDRLGAEVREIRVRSDAPRDVAREARTLPDRLNRLLPDPLVPVEVALPGGGVAAGRAVLRTPVDRMRDRSYFDVEVHEAGDLAVRRYRVDASGERRPKTWMMTREQLGDLVDALM